MARSSPPRRPASAGSRIRQAPETPGLHPVGGTAAVELTSSKPASRADPRRLRQQCRFAAAEPGPPGVRTHPSPAASARSSWITAFTCTISLYSRACGASTRWNAQQCESVQSIIRATDRRNVGGDCRGNRWHPVIYPAGKGVKSADDDPPQAAPRHQIDWYFDAPRRGRCVEGRRVGRPAGVPARVHAENIVRATRRCAMPPRAIDRTPRPSTSVVPGARGLPRHPRPDRWSTWPACATPSPRKGGDPAQGEPGGAGAADRGPLAGGGMRRRRSRRVRRGTARSRIAATRTASTSSSGPAGVRQRRRSPAGNGIMHQINLEKMSPVVHVQDGVAFPTPASAPTHTRTWTRWA